MIIFPAIDLYEGKAVRLYKGDYAQMTVYSKHPEEIALDFAAKGARRAARRRTWTPCCASGTRPAFFARSAAASAAWKR